MSDAVVKAGQVRGLTRLDLVGTTAWIGSRLGEDSQGGGLEVVDWEYEKGRGDAENRGCKP